MARTRTSFRDKILHNSAQQRSKASNYGHLMLPRGVNIFKEEPGTRVNLDMIPYVVTDVAHPDRDEERDSAMDGQMWYRRPYKLHRNIGAENVSIICPTSVGKKCPLCEYRATLLAEGSKWDDDSVKALRPTDRNLYYVVPKGVKKFEEKPHIWDISQFLFQAKLNDELEENEEFGDFPNLEDGLTLKIRFSEEKIGSNTFAETSRIDFERRDYSYTEKQINDLASLDDVLSVKSYAEIKQIFLDQNNDDDDAPPRRTTPRNGHDTEDDRRAELKAYDAYDDGIAAAQKGADEDDCPFDAKKDQALHASWRKGWLEETGRMAAEKKKEPPASGSRMRREEPEAEQPHTSTAREEPRRGASEATNDDCPHGHRFGKDNDRFDECEECKVWTACSKAA